RARAFFTCSSKAMKSRTLVGRGISLCTESFMTSGCLQVAAQRLLGLDGFKQRLEVALAEALGTLALNDFEEDRWAVLQIHGEDLKEVAFLVLVHQDSKTLEIVPILVDVTDALFGLLVVG